MNRSICCFGVLFWGAILSSPLVLRADPVIPAAGSTPVSIAGLGSVTDPAGDCRINGSAERLTIGVPGSDHALCIEQNRMNAPRVLQEVSGDFSAQVTVSGTYPRNTDTLVPGRVPFQGAGLLLWVDSGTYIRLERAQFRNGETDQHRVYPSWELRLGGKWLRPGGTSEGSFSTAAATLRVTRTGNQVTGAVSEDGDTWQELDPLIVKLPEKVQIGVVAGHNTATPFEATFERFTLTPAGKGKE